MTLREIATDCILLLSLCATSLAAPQLNHVTTRTLPEGTHRPEVLALPDGGVMIVVVQPDGPPGVGQVKHRAYRFDAGWNRIGEAFIVTRATEEFGEPADHRAAVVNGELVVIYQSLIYGAAVPQSGPAENAAREQSLMLSRFTLSGQELDRRPIVPHVTDFAQDNFPDFCVLWRNGRFLVSTGSFSRTLKIRQVDLSGVVLSTRVLQTSPFGIGGTIGNSLFHDGSRLFVFSATSPATGELTVTEMDEDLQPVSTLRMSDPSREQNFPIGNLLDSGALYLTYISRDRGGPVDLTQNPYSPYLKVLGSDFAVLEDLPMGQGGFAHVHPTVVRSGNRLLVGWSKPLNRGVRQAPQVQIEEFELTDQAVGQ